MIDSESILNKFYVFRQALREVFVQRSAFSMLKCPDCGKEISKHSKIIENEVFHLEYYKCDSCGTSFKVSY